MCLRGSRCCLTLQLCAGGGNNGTECISRPTSRRRYRHAGYYRSIRERIRELCIHERIDLIHVDLLAMIQYVDPQTNIPAIVDLHDSMTLLCRRMLNAERDWRKRLSAYLGPDQRQTT